MYNQRQPQIQRKKFIAESISIEEKRQDIDRAIQKMRTAVCSTMGPRGGNVLISKFGFPTFSKDGVTVAKMLTGLNLLDRTINRVIVDAADRTVSEAGDGTTTCTLLVAELYQSVRKLRESTNVNGFDVAKELAKYVKEIDEQLEGLKSTIYEDGKIYKEKLTNIATISANNDKSLGQIVSDLVAKTGIDGRINVERSKETKTYATYMDGFTFSTTFIFKEMLSGKAEVKFDNPLFVLADIKFDNIDQLEPIIETWTDSQEIRDEKNQNHVRPLIFIVSDMMGSAKSNVLANHRNGYPIAVIKAPEFLDRRYAMMEDIRIVTGANKVLSVTQGADIDTWGDDFNPSINDEYMRKEFWREFGQAKKVIITKDSCTIIPNEGTAEVCKRHVGVLKERVGSEKESKEDRDFLRKRISQLTAGVGTIYVGGDSDVEVEYKEQLLDDCVKASFCALRTGVLPGGGRALQYLSAFNMLSESESEAQSVARRALLSAMASPYVQIAINGLEDFKQVQEHQAQSIELEPFWSMANHFTGEEIDCWGSGIIDPKGVTISAVKNAVSVVCQLISTKHLIIPQE